MYTVGIFGTKENVIADVYRSKLYLPHTQLYTYPMIITIITSQRRDCESLSIFRCRSYSHTSVLICDFLRCFNLQNLENQGTYLCSFVKAFSLHFAQFSFFSLSPTTQVHEINFDFYRFKLENSTKRKKLTQNSDQTTIRAICIYISNNKIFYVS